MRPVQYAVARAVATNTRRAIRAVIGDPDRLAPLAQSTLDQKVRKGYAYPESPLYATGELRDSFEEDVRATPFGARAAAGTEDPVALYHELGTTRMPARPEVAEGAKDAEEQNFAIFALGANVIIRHEPPVARLVPKYDREPAVPE
jgi:hypothetical protein